MVFIGFLLAFISCSLTYIVVFDRGQQLELLIFNLREKVIGKITYIIIDAHSRFMIKNKDDSYDKNKPLHIFYRDEYPTWRALINRPVDFFIKLDYLSIPNYVRVFNYLNAISVLMFLFSVPLILILLLAEEILINTILESEPVYKLIAVFVITIFVLSLFIQLILVAVIVILVLVGYLFQLTYLIFRVINKSDKGSVAVISLIAATAGLIVGTVALFI